MGKADVSSLLGVNKFNDIQYVFVFINLSKQLV